MVKKQMNVQLIKYQWDPIRTINPEAFRNMWQCEMGKNRLLANEVEHPDIHVCM